jgi:hypothetical protein
MEEKSVHFFGLCRLRGKESWKLGFVVWLGKLRASYPTITYFRFGLGPILVDS